MQKFFSEQGDKNVADWKQADSCFHPFNNQIAAGDQAKSKDVVSMLTKYQKQLGD